MSEKKRPIHLTKYVREDGTVEHNMVETYLGLINGVAYDFEDEFIRIHIDTGEATDIEARLTIDNLKDILEEYNNRKK